MPKTVALLFPGQGSQSVGMGQALCDQYASAREVFAEADAALGYSLSRLCFEGPLDALTLTENTQPALLTMSCALLRVLREELDFTIGWACGHSLGEFSALVAAGALSLREAVVLVRERGRAMQAAVPPGVGSMAAILGLDRAVVDEVCAEAAQGEIVSAANLNGAGQIVIAGHTEAVRRASELARARGAKRCVPLPVSAPFHSALMSPAADRLAGLLEQIPIRPLSFPVIANVDARPNRDAGRVSGLLVQQVCSPVRWEECVLALRAIGCTTAIEVGPGKVLSALVKRIAPEITCLPGEDIEALRVGLAA